MGNLLWILYRVRKPLWKIISIKHNQWSNLFLFFSNSDFPSRMYCDFYRTTLFLERLLFHTFSEWLLRHSSHIFEADIFSEQLLFSPLSEQLLFAAVTFSEELLFQNVNSREQPLLEKEKFFMAIIIRNSCFSLFRIKLFKNNYFFKAVTSA